MIIHLRIIMFKKSNNCNEGLNNEKNLLILTLVIFFINITLNALPHVLQE